MKPSRYAYRRGGEFLLANKMINHRAVIDRQVRLALAGLTICGSA